MWWMLALVVNAQSPAVQAPAPTPESGAGAGAGAGAGKPRSTVLGTAVGTAARRDSPAFGYWGTLALAGAGVGGVALWRRRRRGHTSLLAIKETATLGRGKLLAVVDAGGRRLLIGVTEQGMQLLSNEPQPAEALAARSCAPAAPEPAAALSFDDHLPPLDGEELRRKLAARFS